MSVAYSKPVAGVFVLCVCVYEYVCIYHWRRKWGGGGGNGMLVPPLPPHFHFPLELYVYIILTNNYSCIFHISINYLVDNVNRVTQMAVSK